MITEKDIRRISGSVTFKRGTDIYLGDGVLDFEVKERKQLHHMAAVVQGSGRKTYEVTMTYDPLTEELEESYCDCPAFYSYPGICKHCVAVLLEYCDYMEKLQPKLTDYMPQVVRTGSGHSVREKKQMTTPELKQLLNRKMTARALPVMNKEIWGKVRLEPFLTINNSGSCVEFKIGISHMYVMKDVFAFAERMDTGESFSYGQKLEFPHVAGAFEAQSLGYVAFICDWAAANKEDYRQDNRYSYYYGSSLPKLREIPLGAGALEKLLLLSKDRGITGTVFNSGMVSWKVEDGRLLRKLYLAKKNEGLELKVGAIPEMLLTNYAAAFEEGKIYLTPVEEVRPILDFMDCICRLPGRKAYIEKADIPVFIRELLPVLKENFSCEIEGFQEADYGVYPAVFKYYLDAPQRDMLTGKLLVSYGEDKEYNVFEKDRETEERDIPREMEAAAALSDYCNAFDEQNHVMALAEDEDKLYELLTEGISRMQSYGEVFVSDALKRMKVERTPQAAVGISLAGELLELTITVEDMSREELLEILSKYDRKKKYFRLRDGSFVNMEDKNLAALDELRQGLNLKEAELKKEHISLPRYRALYLDRELEDKPFLTAVRDKAYRQLVRSMRTAQDSDFEIPASLEQILREYQKKGFLWLKTLKENGFGGILADDMGLGKTLQVIALLLSEFLEAKPEDNRLCLIVSPASLVYNWHHEISRFAPALPVKMVVGTVKEREQLLAHTECRDILVTSYDLLRRDQELYKEKEFYCQVIDEAQFVKNHNTQASRAVREIRAGFKLALTGTPIENRLSELWSIFDYLMPGFLFSYQRFREEFETPIVQQQDGKAMERLRKMIRPFVLRRLKKDVLTELPDKLEENMFAPLSGEQQKLYDAHVKRLKLLLDKQTDAEFKTGKIQILAELTKLRQLCCDPALIYDNYEEESAKTAMCMELIENAVGAGHKILLFSQFTSMLERLQRELEKAGISYYVLTGATDKAKRMEMVDAFNADEIPVFCISLKAGGTGLNLTAADIVIHYDPWWNLAVQNQATDRAHRIGQKNVVSVYKLLTKGTIEEKIMQLQEKKRELADQVLAGEEFGSGSFTKEELLELLS